jgi:hypothetical protein
VDIVTDGGIIAVNRGSLTVSAELSKRWNARRESSIPSG